MLAFITGCTIVRVNTRECAEVSVIDLGLVFIEQCKAVSDG